MRILGLVVIILLGLTALSTFFGSWYTIDQGERGVITRFGAVTGEAEPGLGFKMPFVTSVNPITVQTQLIRLENEEAFSLDQQAANLYISVNYSVVASQVTEVYSQYRSVQGLQDRIITPRVRQQLKNVFGRYTAATAIGQRDKLNNEVREAIQAAVKGPVTIEGVQIENLEFSKAYREAIEARMAAEVEVAKSQQKVLNEKQLAMISVTQAQAKADSQLAVATAEAKGVILRGNAEAEAITARGKAIRENPGLVDLTLAEKWTGALPTTMVPGSALPFLSIK